MSVPEMRTLLGLGKTESYWLVKKQYFKVIVVGKSMRVMIDSFESWYANQFHYQKVNGELPGSELKKTLYRVSDLMELLNISKYTAYRLINQNVFETCNIDNQTCIVRDSFEQWYASQNIYRKTSDRIKDQLLYETTLSIPDAARILGVSRQNIYPMIKAGHMETIMVNGRKRVTKDSFENWRSHAEKRSVHSNIKNGGKSNGIHH